MSARGCSRCMDPCQIYFATKDFICHKLEIANDLRNLDVELTAAVLEANADVIVGMKVRACSVDDPDVSPFLDAAKRVAGRPPDHGAPRTIPVHPDDPDRGVAAAHYGPVM